MIGLLGRAAVLLAVFLGALGFALGWGGAHRRWARRRILIVAAAFSATLLGANLLLEAGLLTHDFSISYVAQVGSLRAPAWVSAVSLWSALDGSLLFFSLVLCAFLAAFAFSRRRSPSAEDATALATLLGLGALFALLSAAPASPFVDVLPPPQDGPGPNPLLQNHLLMAIHPPVLYAGLAGLAVPFALACAALRSGKLDRERLASLRSWLLVAWLFLTAGIALGARWAYDVLGWGGYWSWDPVENASLLPWLAATAALHALLRVERRGGGRVWPLALAMAAFLLALLGTFLTRSGVVQSVHSFVPGDLGPALLAVFAVVLLSSVLLLAWRARSLEGDGQPPHRDLALFANNLVLSLFTLLVLAGTLYPVALRAFTGARASVGERYFDGFAVPLGVALLFLMGVGSAPRRSARVLLPFLAAGAGAAAIAALAGARAAGLLAAAGGAGFALASSLSRTFTPLLRAAKGGPRQIGAQLVHGRRRLGAQLAHIGVAVAILAIAASSSGRRFVEQTLRPGETARLGTFELTFQGVRLSREAHRDSYLALFAVQRDGKALGHLAPRMNHYFSTGEALGTPAVLSSPREDLYLSLLRLEPDLRQVAVRVQLAPMVAWLWIGLALIVLGGLVALPPTRRRPVAAAGEPVRSPPEAAPMESHA